MRKLIFALFTVLVLVTPAFAKPGAAASPVDPKVLLKNKIDAVLVILKANMSDAQKRQQIEKTVNPVFYYELMAKLALGPDNWPKLNDEQQKIFINLFVDRLKNSYFDKISLYRGDTETKVTYLDSRIEGNKAVIPVVVASGDSSFNMNYKFFNSGNAWRIYDVEINGVSIIQSYRSQFNQVMAKGTVKDLLEGLRKTENPQQK